MNIELSHSGVEGMKLGIRKKSFEVEKNDQSNMTIDDGR